MRLISEGFTHECLCKNTDAQADRGERGRSTIKQMEEGLDFPCGSQTAGAASHHPVVAMAAAACPELDSGASCLSHRP